LINRKDPGLAHILSTGYALHLSASGLDFFTDTALPMKSIFYGKPLIFIYLGKMIIL